MPAITLSDPVNGTVIDATLHANNNSVLEAVINGNLDNGNLASAAAIAASKIAPGGEEQALLTSGGVTVWSHPPGHVFTHTERTTPRTVNATVLASADQIITSGAQNYDAVLTKFEFYCPRVEPGPEQCFLIIRDGTTVLSTIARFKLSQDQPAAYVPWFTTPTAGSHTYNIAGWVQAAASWTFNAASNGNTGTSASDAPMFLRISKA
jgi:hypothetical protein